MIITCTKPMTFMVIEIKDKSCSSHHNSMVPWPNGMNYGFLERGKGEEQVSCWRKIERKPWNPLTIAMKTTALNYIPMWKL